MPPAEPSADALECPAVPEDPGPLSRQERRTLIEEIEQISLLLACDIGCAPLEDTLRLAIDTSENAVMCSPLERVIRLEQLWPSLSAALAGIFQQTDRRLTNVSINRSLDQVAGSRSALMALARSPQGAHAWRAVTDNVSLGASHRPVVPETRNAITEKTPANQFVVFVLSAFENEARSLLSLARFCDEKNAATRAETLVQLARSRLHCPPLENLPSLSNQELQRLLGGGGLHRCGAPYRAIYAVWQQMTAALHLDWTGKTQFDQASLAPWHLYEIWCFLQTAQALRHNGWIAVGGDVLRLQSHRLRLVPATGQASRLRFKRFDGSDETLDLTYRPGFASARQATGRGSAKAFLPAESIVSQSHAMQPDIGIVVGERLILLDAKFRTYASEGRPYNGLTSRGVTQAAFARIPALQDDINKMHAYRDALVRSGRSAVAAAWCVFPGMPDGDDLITFPDATQQAPYGTAGVGAVRLRPGLLNPAFSKLLAHLTHV